MSAAEVLVTPPREATGLTVFALLTSQRHWGQAKSRRFLREHGIDERKPIGRLTDRQRRLLAAQIGPDGSLPGPSRD